jgi:ribosomal protein L7/L12
METDPHIWERLRSIEQRLAAIELNLQRVMVGAQVEWVDPGPPSQDFPEALELLRAGDKMGAIKLVRTQTGVGLKEAQQVVEGLEGRR